MQALENLVQKIASVATRAIPDDRGVHLRFINRREMFDDVNPCHLPEKMRFVPEGATQLGTQLKDKILQPLVYDRVDKGENLPHPYLILTITDGVPNNEARDSFKNNIQACGRYLEGKGYKKEGLFNVHACSVGLVTEL